VCVYVFVELIMTLIQLCHAQCCANILEISNRFELLVTIRFDPKPIQLFEIVDYLLKSNTYKEGTVSQ